MRQFSLLLVSSACLAVGLSACGQDSAPGQRAETRDAEATAAPDPAIRPPDGLEAPAEPYRAGGNEPFWSISVADGRMTLERPAEPAFTAGAPRPIAIADGYRFDAGALLLDVLPGPCQDSMSGAMFAHSARAEFDGRVLEGCGGGRLAPERVEETIWVVEELDGETVTLSPPPTLEIDADRRATGSDGCNRFTGGLTLNPDGTADADSAGASTRMACPGEPMEVADRYNELRARVDAWRFEGDILILSDGRDDIVRLRQTF